MSAVATAVVGSALIGGVVSSNAASSAAGAQRDAANQATALSAEQYNQQRTDQMPWMDAGKAALNDYTTNKADYAKDFSMGDFHADPGYAFRLAEGQKAIERSAAARGGLNSGATLKSLERFGQGTASDEYQNAYNRFNSDRDRRFNRLASIAGLGQTATQNVGNAGMNFANNAGQNTMAGANAGAAATMANANAINNTIGTGMNTWMQYNMMNRIFPKQGA
jgi:hypothetical protein